MQAASIVLLAAAARAVFDVPADRTWRLLGPGISGCMAEIAFHPTDPKTFYSGTDMGVAFKTTDGGLTWRVLGGASPTHRNPGDLAFGFRSIAVAPNHPRWSGTRDNPA